MATLNNQQPFVTLSNGVRMPQFGLGTWYVQPVYILARVVCVVGPSWLSEKWKISHKNRNLSYCRKSTPGEVGQAVKCALKLGYRHIDCAMVYENQKEVGQALKEAMQELGLKREDIFITSKLWITHYKREHAKKAMDQVLADLGLEYVDLFLLHWPVSLEHVTNADGTVDLMPKDKDGDLRLGFVPLSEAWKVMEELHDEGKTRAIGISNWEAIQVVDLLAHARVKPHVNQVEWHPFYTRYPLLRECEKLAQMKLTAYSPFGNGLDELWTDETLVAIAKKHNKSVAQVILRWILQNGLIVIPKSVNEQRLKENSEIFDFELSPEEIAQIDKLNRDLVTCSTKRYWGVDWIHSS